MIPDLTALVLTVAPSQPTTTPGHLGRAVYNFCLQWIASDNPELAQGLHDNNERKPFTCSTLIGGQRQDKDSRLYRPDQPAWLRLTGLNAAVSAQLLRLAEAPPATIELDNIPFRVLSVSLEPEEHEWAGQTTYEAMAAPYLLAGRRPAYRLGLYLASPTTFRSQGRSQPIPMPDWVFGSLIDRWNSFSPVQVAPEARRFAAECVVLNRYQLKTHAVPFKANVVQMGCQGRAYYVLLNRDPYWASLLNLMIEYSFYSGIGYQTTVGLGQARALV